MKREKFSYLSDLSCPECGAAYDPKHIQTICHLCGAPLLANYDLEAIKKHVDRDEFVYRQKGMWRWTELLPIYDDKNIISLGEGDTPLIQLNRIGHELSLPNLFLKEEGLNPTGSFKSRGLSAAISKAVELNIDKVVIPTAGNAGGALASYAARAGIKSLIYMPRNTPYTNIEESKIAGAEVVLVDGLINLAGEKAGEAEKSDGWFNMSTFKEPYRVEGKKIMGFEIAESFDWNLPDVIIYPTGGGTGLVGMWKAFQELERLGWLKTRKKPKMIAVQAEGCAPIVKAIKGNKEQCDLWMNAQTIATGLCVPLSFADKLILKYIRESKGTAVSVPDSAIIENRNNLAKKEGIFACPEGAATLAGLRKLLAQGFIHDDETIVLFNTGSGIKYISPKHS